MYDLVFWQNIPSIHQAPLMRALSDVLGKRVLVVVPTGISPSRRSMGWENIEYGGADMTIARTHAERMEILERTRDAIAHTFSGAGTYAALDEIRTALLSGSHHHVAIFTESWDPRGLAGLFRRLRFRSRVASLKTGVDTIFTYGELARRQFASLGFSTQTIASFGYSVESHTSGAPHSDRDSHTVDLIFVGSLEERKDPMAILRALEPLKGLAWHLTMVGDGPLQTQLQRFVQESALGSRVEFIPRLSNEAVRERIAASDLLLLPSTYDGWGAVVNEALMSGTPAAVSRNCGSSTLITAHAQGEVLDPDDTKALSCILSNRIKAGPVTQSDREALANWASICISPVAMAQHFYRCVTSGVLAVPPWEALTT